MDKCPGWLCSKTITHGETINPVKTAVFGSEGFLGSALLKEYRSFSPECIGAARSSNDPKTVAFDLACPDIRGLRLAETGHEEAIILAAVTNVARCEREKDTARRINVDGTLELIRQLAGQGIKPIFASSDYVFDGREGRYGDDAVTNPITEYGRHKAEVEARIGEITGDNYLVIRMSKIFSLVKGDGTLLDEMAHALAERRVVKAAVDQVFCPTLISDLISVTIDLQNCKTCGIVNVCYPESISRYNLARRVAGGMGYGEDAVEPIRLHDIEQGRGRPLDTSMSIARLKSILPFQFTPLRECIDKTVSNWR